MDVIVVLVTVPTETEARLIARKIVEEELGKCVNIVPVNSFFSWEGKTKQEEEQLLFIKTGKSRYSRLEKRVKQLHSYELPEIIALPVVKGSQDYLDWIKG